MLSSLHDCVLSGSSLLCLRMNVDILLWLCLVRLLTVMSEDECWHSVMTVSCQAPHCCVWGWMLTFCYDCVMWGSSLLCLRMNVDILLWLCLARLLSVMSEDECWHSVMTVSCQAPQCYVWGWMLTFCYDSWSSSFLSALFLDSFLVHISLHVLFRSTVIADCCAVSCTIYSFATETVTKMITV